MGKTTAQRALDIVAQFEKNGREVKQVDIDGRKISIQLIASKAVDASNGFEFVDMAR